MYGARCTTCSMSHTEPPLSMHAEPFLFRVAFLAPRLPANMHGQAALSFLPRSISVSSTHPVHVVRRRTHRPFLLVMSSLAFSIPDALLFYWTGSLVSTVTYHHPNTFFFTERGSCARCIKRIRITEFLQSASLC
jgi:hypothetical protein